VSRAGYYRHWRASAPRQEEAGLRDVVQRLVLRQRHYGHRRITIELQRSGWAVNKKRVLRLMREDNLLCVPKRAFVPATTFSRHGWRVYPNLTRYLVPQAMNQLWVADITYVRLAEELIYLAVILDAFSRRAIGWSLADHLRANLALAALEMALETREVIPGSLIHHSDRGVQYACGDYICRLQAAGIQPSMSRVWLSVGQRHGRKLHENAEGRGGRRSRLPGSGLRPRCPSASSSRRATIASGFTRRRRIIRLQHLRNDKRR
jgi:putative transposase